MTRFIVMGGRLSPATLVPISRLTQTRGDLVMKRRVRLFTAGHNARFAEYKG